MNCLINFFSSSKEEYIDFFAGIFDPYKHGTVLRHEFDFAIDCMFKDQFSDGFEDEKNSLAADVKRMLTQQKLMNDQGHLVIDRFRRGLSEGTVDIEVFKQALK